MQLNLLQDLKCTPDNNDGSNLKPGTIKANYLLMRLLIGYFLTLQIPV